MHHNIEEWPANMGDNTQFWFFGAAGREFAQEGEWYLVLGERGVREVFWFRQHDDPVCWWLDARVWEVTSGQFLPWRHVWGLDAFGSQ